MYTTTTGPPPSFEIATEERIGEREITTRVTIEGLTDEQVTRVIAEAMRLYSHALERENDQ